MHNFWRAFFPLAAGFATALVQAQVQVGYVNTLVFSMDTPSAVKAWFKPEAPQRFYKLIIRPGGSAD